MAVCRTFERSCEHGLLRVIEVHRSVRQMSYVLGEVGVLAVEQEVWAQACRALACEAVAELDDGQLRLPLRHTVCQDELAHALLEDLHNALAHAIGARVLH